MATTIGIKLYKADYEGSKEAFSDLPKEQVSEIVEKAAVEDNRVYGVQNIPEIQSAPSSIDTTSLEDYEEQSEPGLISGSSLNITMNYKTNVPNVTEGDKSNFEGLLSMEEDKAYLWVVLLPNGRWFAVLAKARVTIGGMGVASAATFTLTIYKQSRVKTGYIAPKTRTYVNMSGYNVKVAVKESAEKKEESKEEDTTGLSYTEEKTNSWE